MAQKCVFAPAEEVLAHGETAAVLGESSEKHTLAFSAPSICPELVLTNRRFSKSEKGGLQWKHTKGVFSFAHCTLTLWCWLSPVVETSAPGRFPTSAMLPPQRNTVPFLSFASMSVPSLSWQKIVLREKTAQKRGGFARTCRHRSRPSSDPRRLLLLPAKQIASFISFRTVQPQACLGN